MVQEGIPLFYTYDGVPHYTFPEAFVSTGTVSLICPQGSSDAKLMALPL